MDTKTRIMEAAKTLFSRKGLEGVSIREIAREAGVNLAAINYHFQTKEQLYMAVITRYFEQMCSQTANLCLEGGGDEEDYIRAFVHHHFQALFHGNREMELIIARELAVPSERRNRLARQFFTPGLMRLIEVIQRGIDRGRFRRVDASLAALSLVGMCVFYANKREMLAHMLDLSELPSDFRMRVEEHTHELFLRGIRA